MKQNTSPQAVLPVAWTTLQIRAAMVELGATPKSIGARSGLTPQAISLAIHGNRKGKKARLAIALALGRQVTEIWPDALLPMRERRLRRAL
jgi:lambda repressor-like predicted transcriptional regulator